MSKRTDYQFWTIAELKVELRKHKAKLSGKKAELIKRLIFYDINSSQAIPGVEYQMSIPEKNEFKDLHGGMKKLMPRQIKLQRLTEYLHQFDKSYDTKYEDLYDQRYVRYIRMCVKDQFFFTSSVWAEMKKSVAYIVDLQIDRNGVIEEAQCDCGVGQGPTAHCKHVATTYYGLTKFQTTGNIVTELTCTQKLQTFHHAKPYKGSPMKAKSFRRMKDRENARPMVYDPRPFKFRKRLNKQSEFRNQCLNEKVSSKMPARHLFEPANPYAIALDHDYLNLHQEDQFLIDNMVIDPEGQVDEDSVTKVEVATRGQGACKEWMDIRRHHITASNFGEICKATERKDMQRLARRLVAPVSFKSEATSHGLKYEAVAVEQYEQLQGVKTEVCGLFISTDNPVLAASPDRVVSDNKLLEVKCPYVARDKKITTDSVQYLQLVDKELHLDQNHPYYFQIQGQLYCSKKEFCDLVVYTKKDLKVLTIKRNETFIIKMVSDLLSFYNSHFRKELLDFAFYQDYNN